MQVHPHLRFASCPETAISPAPQSNRRNLHVYLPAPWPVCMLTIMIITLLSCRDVAVRQTITNTTCMPVVMRHGTSPSRWLVWRWLDGNVTGTAGCANCFRGVFQIEALADRSAVPSILCVLSPGGVSAVSVLCFRHEIERSGIHAKQAQDFNVRSRGACILIRSNDRMGVYLSLASLCAIEQAKVAVRGYTIFRLLASIHAYLYRVDWFPLLLHDHVYLYAVHGAVHMATGEITFVSS
jgi:hypothetical protein